MISNPFALLGLNLMVALAVMLVLWAFTARRGDATAVDVAWAYNLGLLVVLDAVLADGWIGHRLLVALIVVAWSVRLGTHLLVGRVLHGDGEDGRYATLRERWGDAADRKFLVFFAAQAGFDLVFSIAFVPTVLNGEDRLGAIAIRRCGPRRGIDPRRGHGRSPARPLEGRPSQPGCHVPRRPVGLVATPQLLLRDDDLDRRGPHRSRCAVGMGGVRDADLPAGAAVHRHRHPRHRGPVAEEPARGLPALPGGDQHVHPVAAGVAAVGFKARTR